MPMTDAFRDLIAVMAVGNGYTAFDNANAYVGVGDGDAGFNSSHTDLQGSHKLRRGMKTGKPDQTNNQMVFEARFLEADATFHWKEGAIFNHESSGIMMNRFLDDQGVKPADEIWDYEITVTVSHPSP